MKCFKCLKSFQTVNHLILHLKHNHKLAPTDYYKCITNDCQRVYGNLNSFRKHLNSTHVSKPCTHVISSRTLVEQEITNEKRTIDSEQSTPFSVPLTLPIEDSCKNGDEINLELEASSLITALYNNSLVPRNVVNLVVESISSFIEEAYVPCLKGRLRTRLQFNDYKDPNHILKEINTLFDEMSNPFENLNTEYKRLKYLKQNLSYAVPLDYIIGQASIERTVNGLIVSEPAEVIGKMIPLKNTLRSIFEIPDLLNKTKHNVKTLMADSTILGNFIQGELWKKMSLSHDNKTVFPLFIYFDDFETGNPLGSHAGNNKLGALYASIPCLPSKYVSTLNHIYLALLFHSNDRQTFGNAAVFNGLIDELNNLKNHGITVDIGKIRETVYFECALMLGDNLGLHSILGFVESFSANYSCRICRVPKPILKTLCTQDEQLLRTKVNYETDLLINNLSETGIKEACVWNRVKGFHAVENVAVDVMHDLFEGVCKYDLTCILSHLIFKLKLFTVETLNSRIRTFKYGNLEKSNQPPEIIAENSSVRIKMSASEMTCFARYLGLIIGDLVPQNNNVWQFYLKLRKIIEIVTSPNLNEDNIIELSCLISEHHTMYCNIFKQHLTPKFHMMVHYPRMIRLLGPLVHCSSMRYESKHRGFKQTANTSCSSKNIIHTLTVKNQLKLYHFINQFNHSRDKIFGPVNNIKVSDYVKYFPEVESQNLITCTKWVNICGTKYTSDTIVVIDVGSPFRPIFGRICSVFVINEAVHFLVSPLPSIVFNEHFHAYEVDCQVGECSFAIAFDMLPDKFPCLLVQKGIDFYVATRHLITKN